MTAISVPFGSRAVRDRLRSFNFLHGALPSVHISDDGMQYPRRRPHSIFHQAQSWCRWPNIETCQEAIAQAEGDLNTDPSLLFAKRQGGRGHEVASAGKRDPPVMEGPWCRGSEEEAREPVSDIGTLELVDSLKALDPRLAD